MTTIVPATMTLPEETLMEISKIAGNYKATEGADLAGINMEGPFISPGKKGAQASTHIVNRILRCFADCRRLQMDCIVW